MFANGPGGQGSTPGRVIRKTQKWYFIPASLTVSSIRYGMYYGTRASVSIIRYKV